MYLMQTFLGILWPAVAVLVGAGIGFAFGFLQNAALRHNEKLEQAGKLKSGWSLMPGSGTRIAFLLLALVLIQVICPMLFAGNTQWWVSGGLLVGYAWILVKQIREKRARMI
jgi:hypothetical protein